uniref:Uncharacterized protein n=1 Tax=Anguilla anguilla TaxID=7936 RepID=A0A0E9RIW4_ANGAN
MKVLVGEGWYLLSFANKLPGSVLSFRNLFYSPTIQHFCLLFYSCCRLFRVSTSSHNF